MWFLGRVNNWLVRYHNHLRFEVVKYPLAIAVRSAVMGCDQHCRTDQLGAKRWLFQHREPSIFFQVAWEQDLERPEFEEHGQAQVVRVVEARVGVGEGGYRDAAG